MGKEFNTGALDGLFAGTPPLEAMRALVSEAATYTAEDETKIIMINDVSRAFFEAKATRDICVELPSEAVSEREKKLDLVGHLKMSLYGTRDAAMNWQEEIARQMHSWGFSRGKYNPWLYENQSRGLKTLVHGDDFMSVGG